MSNAAATVSVTVQKPMNREEALATCQVIRKGLDDIREMALELRDREGWKALGYPSWAECIAGEFGRSKNYINRQIAAALIEQEVVPMGTAPAQPRIPERQLRPLAAIEPGKRAEVWEEAKATAPEGRLTARHVQETVDRKLPRPEGGAHGHRQGGTLVNGVASEDPPAIARARAAGRIAPDATVEITEPEPDPTPEAEAEAVPMGTGGEATEGDEAEDDAAWLEGLPARPLIAESLRRTFDADALLYRRLEPARGTFLHHARRALNLARRLGGSSSSGYAYRLSRFLKTDHPRHWLPCPSTEDGGCGGVGTIGMLGQCPKCYGRGYWIK
ncbi:hypothetical protein [Singulisphaera sp. PoT]|uniref:hypothetical protein n=1 Tax=Singulisphaera sp. PoT TaxID=3411797 RepID=UPI003BF5D3F9